MRAVISLVIFFGVLNLSVVQAAPPPTTCHEFEQAEYAVLADRLKAQDTTACQTDTDCAQRSGVPGYYCSVYLNKPGVAVFDAYRDGLVFKTLDDKFRSIGCFHTPPPCPHMGEPICRTGVCKGKFSPN